VSGVAIFIAAEVFMLLAGAVYALTTITGPLYSLVHLWEAWRRGDWPTLEKMYDARQRADRLQERVDEGRRAEEFLNGWGPAPYSVREAITEAGLDPMMPSADAVRTLSRQRKQLLADVEGLASRWEDTTGSAAIRNSRTDRALRRCASQLRELTREARDG
jgi:hypothetical protein